MKATHVRNHSTKFHIHMIWYEHSTTHVRFVTRETIQNCQIAIKNPNQLENGPIKSTKHYVES